MYGNITRNADAPGAGPIARKRPRAPQGIRVLDEDDFVNTRAEAAAGSRDLLDFDEDAALAGGSGVGGDDDIEDAAFLAAASRAASEYKPELQNSSLLRQHEIVHGDSSPPRRPRITAPAVAVASGDSSPPRRPRGMQAPSAAPAPAPAAGPANHGGTSRTVYRDRSGRVIDVDEALKASLEGRDADVQAARKYDWNVGEAQKLERAEAAAALAEAAAAPVARYAGDARLEAALRAQNREGDPMAAFLGDGGGGGDERGASLSSRTGKPLYSGPPPPPNRYGIRPGYRWDGVVRGNGFEERVLQSAARKSAREDTSYSRRTADM